MSEEPFYVSQVGLVSTLRGRTKLTHGRGFKLVDDLREVYCFGQLMIPCQIDGSCLVVPDNSIGLFGKALRANTTPVDVYGSSVRRTSFYDTHNSSLSYPFTAEPFDLIQVTISFF
jgi:hypothetical protein